MEEGGVEEEVEEEGLEKEVEAEGEGDLVPKIAPAITAMKKDILLVTVKKNPQMAVAEWLTYTKRTKYVSSDRILTIVPISVILPHIVVMYICIYIMTGN